MAHPEPMSGVFKSRVREGLKNMFKAMWSMFLIQYILNSLSKLYIWYSTTNKACNLKERNSTTIQWNAQNYPRLTNGLLG